jgi:predicted nucleic acid-binding protein
VRSFFYDTWAFLALANTRDRHHDLCVEADRQLEKEGYVAITSDYIFDETLTSLHVAAGPTVAVTFADLLLSRVNAEELLLVQVNEERQRKALELFRRLCRSERRLSFTDCTSFAVMQELECKIAFTADRHFHRAGKGIRPLLQRDGERLSLYLPADSD